MEALKTAMDSIQVPLCYNGDITSKKSFDMLLAQFPQTNCVMVGRGILKNPALISELTGIDYDKKHTIENFKAFHNELFENYAATMPDEMPTLFKMKDLWTYLSESFKNSEKHLKKIRKATSFSEYKIAVANLFREYVTF